MVAQWLRLGEIAQRDFDATCDSLAAAQARSAAPTLVWAEEAARYPFALVAPLKFAPGRADRWLSWGLAAAVATYRQFGVPAYLDGEIYFHGRDIARHPGARRRVRAHRLELPDALSRKLRRDPVLRTRAGVSPAPRGAARLAIRVVLAANRREAS